MGPLHRTEKEVGPMDCGAKVTLCGRSGTVRYWARVGSLICPSEKVSTLSRKKKCYFVGKLVFSFLSL